MTRAEKGVTTPSTDVIGRDRTCTHAVSYAARPVCFQAAQLPRTLSLVHAGRTRARPPSVQEAYGRHLANGLAVQHSRGSARSAAHLWRAPSGAVPACFAMGSSALSCALLSLFGRGRDRGPYRLHVHARPTRACPAMPPALGVPARKQSRWSGGSVATCPCGAVESQTGVLVSTLASASVDNNPQRHGGGRAVEPPESRASSGGRGGRGSPRLSSVGCPATLPKPGRKRFGGRADRVGHPRCRPRRDVTAAAAGPRGRCPRLWCSSFPWLRRWRP